MSKVITKFLLLIIIIALASCAKIYSPAKYRSIILNHKTLVFLPVNFDIIPQYNTKQNQMDLYPLDLYYGLKFRDKVVEKLKQKKLSVDFIDLNQIDKYFIEKIENGDSDFTYDRIFELGQEFGADAILIYCARTKKNYNHLEELKQDFLNALHYDTYNLEPTTEIRITLQIYDTNSKELIWEYSHYNKGMYFTTPMFISKPIIREIVNEFPYNN